MIKSHKDLTVTIHPDQLLFRYMDLYKLLSLLQTQTVFFSALATMQDAHEGKLTDRTVEAWLTPDLDETQRKTVVENMHKLNGSTGAYIKICSFTIADTENEILWNHYGQSEYSVCLETSLSRLTDVFKDTVEDVCPGEIAYVERSQYVNSSMNLMNIASLKSKEYQAERELRLLLMNPAPFAGVSLRVNVTALIQRIIVSPRCHGWRFGVIQDVVRRYQKELKVEPSGIVYRVQA